MMASENDIGWPNMKPELCEKLVGRILVKLYGRVPFRVHLLRAVTRMEGGEFRSTSLRRVLEAFHGVTVGAHSYGSLLTPGMSDRFTEIGRYVSVGPGVRRIGASHPLDGASMHPYWYNSGLGMVPEGHDVHRSSIVIESEVWLGANVTILPNCARIGYGAVVGAGAVVTKDVDDFAVVVGNPARQVSTRLTPALRTALLQAQPWALPPAEYEALRNEILSSAAPS